MPVHWSLSSDLQQIRSPTLRVLGPGQLKKHTGQLHFHWAQSSKFSGSEQCEFMLTLATQAGSFAVGYCLTFTHHQIGGLREQCRIAVLWQGKEPQHWREGYSLGAVDVPCLPLLAKGSPLASVDSELQAAWQRAWCTFMLSGLVGTGLTVYLSVCDWGKGLVNVFHLWPLRKIWHTECLGM